MATRFSIRLFAFLLFLSPFRAAFPQTPTFRLLDNARPVRYSIDLTVIPGEDTFRGIADIELMIYQVTPVLWLNARDLRIEQARLRGGNVSLPTKIVDGNGFAGFAFDSPLVPGRAVLHVEYHGKISKTSSSGLFQLRDGSQTQWYVFSQFEPTDARRAFPCFDEPKFKTPWQLTLHVKRDQLTASNTPIVSETLEGGGMKRVTFAVTRPLPSYLVAMAVGPFEVVDAGKAGRKNTPLRILVPQGHRGEAEYARASIPQLLKRLENYFDFPYPYPKLDSVIMPISDFAMENVGLITFGQSMLLSKPEVETDDFRRRCSETAAHEMAHQWFGDLVTTSWWNDIWLNESFASWIADKIIDEWKPEWQMDVTEVQRRLEAMRLDSLISARRIRQPIETESDIANVIDAITYQKGPAVIRMFERWIGEEQFEKGVRFYIKRNADKTTTTADFLSAISRAAGRNVAPAFNTFLDQSGVPLLSAELRCDRGRPHLALTQRRSLPIGSHGSANQNWMIPVCVKYSADDGLHHECSVLSEQSSEINLAHASSCPSWVLANEGENGYYRVLYQGDLLDRVLGDHGGHLSISERVGVLGDVSAMVDSGELTPAKALAFVQPFSHDTDWRVVSETLNIAGILDSAATPEELRGNAARFFRIIYGGRAHELGWSSKPGDSDGTRALRQRLLGLVAAAGEDKDLVTESQKLALRWLDDPKAIDRDMAGPVMGVATAHGDQVLFDRIHAAARHTQDRQERQILIRAMAGFQDPGIVKQRLGLLLTDEFDPRESFFAFLFSAPRQTPRLPFEFVQGNLDALLKKLPRELGGDLAAELPGVGRGFCDASERADLAAFFEPRVNQYTGGRRNLAQTLERIDLCIARKQILEPSVAEFLKDY